MIPVDHLGKTVGYVTGTKFVTHRRPEHFFVKFKGFGLSTAVINRLRRANVQNVLILYHKKNGEQSAYTAPLTAFYQHGRPWTDKQADTQLILPITQMNRN